MSIRIVVLGATGFTGRLIGKDLKNKNIDFIASGRDEKKLNDLYYNREVATVDVMDKSQLDDLMKNTDIIVNAVGPFNLYGYKVIKSAAEHGATYLDITGEQHFVKFGFDKINKIAQENNSLIVSSCSFESLVADLMAAEICHKDTDYEDISSFYYFSNSRPSIGTKFTMQLTRNFHTYLLRNGKLEVITPMDQHLEVEIDGLSELKYASFVPYPEVLFYKMEYNVNNAGSFYLFNEAPLEHISFKKGLSQKDIKKTIERFKRKKSVNPTYTERKNQQFNLAVVSKSKNGRP